MPTSNDYYPNYPEACEVVIPIPMMLQAEVISKPPVCHTHNGYEEYKPEEEYKPVEEKEEQPA
jgi:hypothetical protein